MRRRCAGPAAGGARLRPSAGGARWSAQSVILSGERLRLARAPQGDGDGLDRATIGIYLSDKNHCRKDVAMAQLAEKEKTIEAVDATLNYFANLGEKPYTETAAPGSTDVRVGSTPDPRTLT